MPGQAESAKVTPATGSGFDTTLWSTVLAAGQHDDSTRARSALEKLCQTYWPPLYAFLRRQGRNPQEAQDLTQGFFASLLQKQALRRVCREKGKFRSFLLRALQNYARDEWVKASAEKRGGGLEFISLDLPKEEDHVLREPADHLDPAKLYERRWAQTVIAAAVARLERDYAEQGKATHYHELSRFLFDKKTDVPREEVARRLGITVAAVDVAVHRLKKRFGELLREVVAETVASRTEVEEELRNLIEALQP